MSAIQLASFEFRRQKHPLQILAVIFLILLPLLYGALYLWSAWDPYGQLNKLPAAVVNLDRPATADGKTVDAGGAFVDKLKADPSFDWQVTDAETAQDGLVKGDYLIVLTIPEDFSESLTSAATDDPKQAQVQLRVDDANGYLVNIIAETARTELTQQLDSAITTEYFEAVYGGLEQLRTGVGKLSEGGATLEAGVVKEADGASQLVTGLGTLQSGSSRAVTGATSLESGAAKVAAGNRQLADRVVPVLDDIAEAVPTLASTGSELAKDAATLTSQVADGSSALQQRQSAVAAALEDLSQDDPSLSDSDAFQSLTSAISNLSDSVDAVAETSGAIASATGDLEDAAQDLASNAGKARQDLRAASGELTELADGAEAVAQGASTLRAGTIEFNTGVGEALAGATELQTGLGRLDSGSKELKSGLDQLIAAVPAISPQDQERDAAILGSPASLQLDVDNPANVYGRGLAPFFFAIALWVFGIAAFLVLRPINRRALAIRGARNLTLSLAGWLPVFTVGLTGGLLLLAVVTLTLGLDPVHLGWSVGLIAVATAAFTAVAHALRLAFGVVGSAIALVLLMLQLTSSGGIYPVETLPEPLRFIHPLLPMSYLVDGLRVTFTGGRSEQLLLDIAVIGAFGLVALALAWLTVRIKRRWTFESRFPVLEE